MKRKTVFFKNLICGLLALAPFLAWADHYVAQNGQTYVANYGGNSSPTLFFTNTCTAPITAYPNAGNLNADPMFADFDGQDFRLTKASPCLNAGVNQNWMVGATDLDGHPRIDRNGPGIVDMGCYEFVYPGSMIVIR